MDMDSGTTIVQFTLSASPVTPPTSRLPALNRVIGSVELAEIC